MLSATKHPPPALGDPSHAFRMTLFSFKALHTEDSPISIFVE